MRCEARVLDDGENERERDRMRYREESGYEVSFPGGGRGDRWAERRETKSEGGKV